MIVDVLKCALQSFHTHGGVFDRTQALLSSEQKRAKLTATQD